MCKSFRPCVISSQQVSLNQSEASISGPTLPRYLSHPRAHCSRYINETNPVRKYIRGDEKQNQIDTNQLFELNRTTGI